MVTFAVDGALVATVPITLFNAEEFYIAEANFATSSIAAGTHVVTAHYNGDDDDLPSDSPPVTLIVAPASTSTVLVARPNPSAGGQSVVFTAGVASITGAVPTGAVTFLVDGVGHTAPLAPAAGGQAGTATFTFPAFAIGTHQVTAHYDGSPDFTPSASTTVAQVVDRTATVTALAASPSPAAVGQPVLFSAVITPVVPQDGPTGTVVFLVDGKMAATAPVGPLPDGGPDDGLATFLTSSLGPGNHTVTAVYSGDASFGASTSVAVFETITPPPINAAPSVVEVLRYGYHAMPTALAVVFDQPLDPATAENPHNYVIDGPYRQVIPVLKAVLAPGGEVVVLQPSRRLNVHWTYTLTTVGTPPSGVTSSAGTYIGFDPVETITLRNLVWRQRLAAAHAVDAALASGVLARRTAVAVRHR